MAQKKHRKRMIATMLCLLWLMLSAAEATSLEGVHVPSAPLSPQTKSANGIMRVALSSLGSPQTLNLTVQGSYRISTTGDVLGNGTRLTFTFQSATGQMSLSWDGKTQPMGRAFTLSRQDGTGSLLISQSRNNENPYPGDISFEAVSSGSGYTLSIIAHVYIEEYLYGVVPYEMGNASSLEALKAQAVAARTYALRMATQRSGGRYDVKDTTSDQFYSGTPSGNANCKAAVDATTGIVLMHGADYVTTYYGASNGGQTEISRGGSNYAYMKVKDDPFDYANPSSTVKSKTLSANLADGSNPSALVALLKRKLIAKLNQGGYSANDANTSLQTLEGIMPHSPQYASPSRLYTKMDFTLSAVTWNASGQQVRLTETVTCGIFDELESMLAMSIQTANNELWSVETTSGGFALQARRYGHGMGMSQRGAMYMGKLGYTYDQILGFYYDGCQRVKHNFSNATQSVPPVSEPVLDPPAETESIVSPWADEEPSLPAIGYVTVTASDFVNLRADGSLNARVLGTAPRGAVLTVLSQNGAWARVRYGTLTAFVNTGFVSAVRSQASVEPVREGSPQPVDVPPPIQSVASPQDVGALLATVNTTYDSLNMRSEASVTSPIIATIPPKARVTVVKRGSTWCAVAYGGTSGYVMSKFLTFGADEYEPWESSVPAIQTARVSTSGGTLNLRAEPWMGSRVLYCIPQGAIVEVESRGAQWCGVVYRGMRGHVMSTFLAFDTYEEPYDEPFPSVPAYDPQWAQGTQYATVATYSGGLNLREYPSRNARVLASIPRGYTLTVQRHEGTWCQVQYQGLSGYVMTEYLRFDADVPMPYDPIDFGDEDDTGWPDASTAMDAWVRTPSGGLNLRQAPNLQAPILATIPQNAQVQLLEEGNEWSYVVYRQMYGYVMSQYLAVDGFYGSSWDEYGGTNWM